MRWRLVPGVATGDEVTALATAGWIIRGCQFLGSSSGVPREFQVHDNVASLSMKFGTEGATSALVICESCEGLTGFGTSGSALPR